MTENEHTTPGGDIRVTSIPSATFENGEMYRGGQPMARPVEGVVTSTHVGESALTWHPPASGYAIAVKDGETYSLRLDSPALCTLTFQAPLNCEESMYVKHGLYRQARIVANWLDQLDENIGKCPDAAGPHSSVFEYHEDGMNIASAIGDIVSAFGAEPVSYPSPENPTSETTYRVNFVAEKSKLTLSARVTRREPKDSWEFDPEITIS